MTKTLYFNFDNASLKYDVKSAVIILLMWGQRDEISFRPLEFTYCIMEFSRFSQDLHVKNQKLFRIKISFNIYHELRIDQGFCQS